MKQTIPAKYFTPLGRARNPTELVNFINQATLNGHAAQMLVVKDQVWVLEVQDATLQREIPDPLPVEPVPNDMTQSLLDRCNRDAEETTGEPTNE